MTDPLAKFRKDTAIFNYSYNDANKRTKNVLADVSIVIKHVHSKRFLKDCSLSIVFLYSG